MKLFSLKLFYFIKIYYAWPGIYLFLFLTLIHGTPSFFPFLAISISASPLLLEQNHCLRLHSFFCLSFLFFNLASTNSLLKAGWANTYLLRLIVSEAGMWYIPCLSASGSSFSIFTFTLLFSAGLSVFCFFDGNSSSSISWV